VIRSSSYLTPISISSLAPAKLAYAASTLTRHHCNNWPFFSRAAAFPLATVKPQDYNVKRTYPLVSGTEGRESGSAIFVIILYHISPGGTLHKTHIRNSPIILHQSINSSRDNKLANCTYPAGFYLERGEPGYVFPPPPKKNHL